MISENEEISKMPIDFVSDVSETPNVSQNDYDESYLCRWKKLGE